MKYILGTFLCIFILTFSPFNTKSQVKIEIDVENLDDSVFYLLKYKSDKSHTVIDTSSFIKNKITITNKDNYDEGIYVLADSRQQPLFEILIGKDQKFSLYVKELMDLKTYKVKGSKETSDYFEVYSKTAHNQLYMMALKSELEYFPENIYKIDSVKNYLHDYHNSIISKRPDSFLSTYVKFIKEVEAPKEYHDNSESYIMNHYFDDLPLNDNRILNSRLLKNKLDIFFNHYMQSQTPEFICQKIDYLIEKSNAELRNYILWYLYSKYFNPDNARNELVFIHLVDNYFSKLEIDNLTDNIRREIIKRADVLRKITIGNQAPTLYYTDDNGKMVSLDAVNSKYIVLFFYKPDCQKCIKDKRYFDYIKKTRDDVEVLSINISEDNYKNVSQDIVNQFDITITPTIYLLDKNKTIVAKHIGLEDIKSIIDDNQR